MQDDDRKTDLRDMEDRLFRRLSGEINDAVRHRINRLGGWALGTFLALAVAGAIGLASAFGNLTKGQIELRADMRAVGNLSMERTKTMESALGALNVAAESRSVITGRVGVLESQVSTTREQIEDVREQVRDELREIRRILQAGQASATERDKKFRADLDTKRSP